MQAGEGIRGALRRQPATALLAVAITASGLLLLYWGSKLTFLLDDWEFLLYRRGFTADAILEPHGPHISIAPILIYKGLLATVGMGSALPFRLVSTAAFLLSAVLLYVYLRRRVGAWPALFACTIVLFLGAAFEDLLWAFQIGYFGSMAAGLGMLLALERESRGGDRLACLLLLISILFSSLGLPFAAGAAVAVLIGPDRWRRSYVFVGPLIFYAAWWLGWGHNGESSISLSNAASTPVFVLDGIASSVASLLGLIPSSAAGSGLLDWGRPLALAAILLAIYRVTKLPKITPQLWAVGAIAASFWILAGLNQIPGREPTSSRYQYVGVIFLLLVAAELLRGIRWDRRWLAGMALVTLVSLAGNVWYLHRSYVSYRITSQIEKADLGALDIARSTVEPGFLLDEGIADTAYVHVDAGSYFSAEDAFGTPAYDPSEIADAPEYARVPADKVIFNALGMGLTPPPPTAAKQACTRVTPEGGFAEATLATGANEIRTGAAPISDLRAARFARTEFPVDLAITIPPHSATVLEVPKDGSEVPWRLQLETEGPVEVC